jgi:hypothetical protein
MQKQCSGIASLGLFFASLIWQPTFASEPLLGASREFAIDNWRYAPGNVVFSGDGTAICALSLGIDGSTRFFAWEIANGKPLTQGDIRVGPIPHRGGCLAGDEGSAKHPPISQPTWDSPTSPVFVWNVGQQIDLQLKEQTPILQHPGWDAWESFSIVPGWSLSNLEVRPLNSGPAQPIVHWVEWNLPQGIQVQTVKQPFIKRFLVWSAFRRKSIECLSADGRWIALASPSDPDFDNKDTKAIVSGLGSALRLRVWSVGNPAPARSFSLQKPPVAIELSPHGNYLIARDKGEVCDVIETANGTPIGTLGKHQGWVYWSENEENLYVVDVPKRTISRYQASPFQLKAAFRLTCRNERGFEHITVDPDHARAVGWFYLGQGDNVIATTLQLFDLRRVGPALSPDTQGK